MSGASKYRQESGQAMTEYVILLVVVALSLSFMMSALPSALSDYVQAIYFCVSRPVP